jgi:hypothetical protein
MTNLSDVINASFTGATVSGLTASTLTLAGYNTKRQDLGTLSSNINLDLSQYNDFTFTAGGSIALTPINVPASGTVSFSISITNGGQYTLTFAGSRYPSATPPTLTSTGVDTLTFVSYDNGITWRGNIVMKDTR